MNEMVHEALEDLRALQESGKKTRCPRCGRDTMKPDLRTNALSRHADGIYICDECGTAEAMLDFMNNPLPIECWAVFRIDQHAFDFKDAPGRDVWEKIRMEHGPILIDLYRQWLEESPGASFTPYRWFAFERCPGLTEIWERPFQAKYTVADGELILRLKKTGDGIEIEANLLEPKK